MTLQNIIDSVKNFFSIDFIFLSSIISILIVILLLDQSLFIRIKKFFKKLTKNDISVEDGLLSPEFSLKKDLTSNQETNLDGIEDDIEDDELIEDMVNKALSSEDREIVIRAGLVLLKNKLEYLPD